MNKIPVTRSVVSARDTSALLLLTGGARMGSESLAEFVGLPNVEFSAARTVFSRPGVDYRANAIYSLIEFFYNVKYLKYLFANTVIG